MNSYHCDQEALAIVQYSATLRMFHVHRLRFTQAGFSLDQDQYRPHQAQQVETVESLHKISTLMGNSPEICREHYAVLKPEKMGETVQFRRNEGIDRSDDHSKEMLEEILRELKKIETTETGSAIFAPGKTNRLSLITVHRTV